MQVRRNRGHGVYGWSCRECIRIAHRTYDRRKYAEQKAART